MSDLTGTNLCHLDKTRSCWVRVAEDWPFSVRIYCFTETRNLFQAFARTRGDEDRAAVHAWYNASMSKGGHCRRKKSASNILLYDIKKLTNLFLTCRLYTSQWYLTNGFMSPLIDSPLLITYPQGCSPLVYNLNLSLCWYWEIESPRSHYRWTDWWLSHDDYIHC